MVEVEDDERLRLLEQLIDEQVEGDELLEGHDELDFEVLEMDEMLIVTIEQTQF